MSRVKEIHHRLKKISEAKFFPDACVDLAGKLIRDLASAEFKIVGTIELAWRRGFQAGVESSQLASLGADTLRKLIVVLDAVGVKRDMIFADGDTIIDIEPINDEVRFMARDLLDLVYALEKSRE
jgi:hypothetical protein